jgi:hypothetical protein
MEAPQKLEVELLYDPAIGIHRKECKLVYIKDTCTLMFITPLFTTAKLWKKPRCPKNMWYLYKWNFI